MLDLNRGTLEEIQVATPTESAALIEKVLKRDMQINLQKELSHLMQLQLYTQQNVLIRSKKVSTCFGCDKIWLCLSAF